MKLSALSTAKYPRIILGEYERPSCPFCGSKVFLYTPRDDNYTFDCGCTLHYYNLSDSYEVQDVCNKSSVLLV